MQELSATELLSEFETFVAQPGQVLWSLEDLAIKPPLLRAFFQQIGESPIQLPRALAIDLGSNRLENATSDDFKVVLLALNRPGKERLIARFGFEIFFPALITALQELGMEDLLARRVYVSTPWQDSIVARLDQANRINSQRLALLEKRNDPEEQLRQMKVYRGTDDQLIEECVTNAVAAALDDSTVIISSRYNYKGFMGDLDGLVIGRCRDQEVVVLVESKHSLDSHYTKARQEIINSAGY